MSARRLALKRHQHAMGTPRLSALTLALLTVAIGLPVAADAQQQAIMPAAVGAPSSGQFQNIVPVAVDPKLQNLPDNRPMAVGNVNAAVGHVRMEVDRNALPADGQSVINVKVTLFDKNDKPLDSTATITIEASAGRIHLLDRATDELGPGARRSGSRHTRCADAGGARRGDIPAGGAERAYRCSTACHGRIAGSHRARQLCAGTAPMLATGLIEGVASFARNPESGQGNSLFENELNNYHETDGGRDEFGARSEFFLKGVIRGDYLLTMSYDSDKAGQSPLFRDITPEQYYPVYGDSSIKGFDAQTTQKLYVRGRQGSFVRHVR